MYDLPWLIVAFLAGGILTAGIIAYRQKRRSLRERFDGLGSMLGRNYVEIAAAVRRTPRITEPRPDGQTLRTWQDGNYSISLLFDRQDYCLGVMEERR